MEYLYSLVKELGEKYACEKIVLFGSRARGDAHERSDIDLAVYGLNEQKQALFWADVDDLPSLLKFDLVFVSENTDTDLLKNIKKDGVILYERPETENQ